MGDVPAAAHEGARRATERAAASMVTGRPLPVLIVRSTGGVRGVVRGRPNGIAGRASGQGSALPLAPSADESGTPTLNSGWHTRRGQVTGIQLWCHAMSHLSLSRVHFERVR